VKAKRHVPIKRDEGIIDQLNVSRETSEKLAAYLVLLEKWHLKMNLVSTSTLPDAWRRHILDSAQLAPYLPQLPSHIMDIGSGAGFPGLVLAIITGHKVTLVESDTRKSIFLRTVICELNLTAEVVNQRVESLPPLGAKIITARALAPLDRLLGWLDQHLDAAQKCLFLKGVSVQDELTALNSYPTIEHRVFPSISNADGVVLELDVSNHPGTEH
jgi:16S rRNA (guanine527-N7)-methyltransferase